MLLSLTLRGCCAACMVWQAGDGSNGGIDEAGDYEYGDGDGGDGGEYEDGGGDGGEYGDDNYGGDGDGDGEWDAGAYDEGDGYEYGQEGAAGFADEVIKEGWLTKSNPQGKRWKKRWCVLSYAEFTYYTSAEKRDRQSKGSFELADVEVREGWDLERSPRTPHVLTVNVPGRAYYFCCSSDEVLGEWLDAFNLALGYEDGEEGDGYDEYGGYDEDDGRQEGVGDEDDAAGGDADEAGAAGGDADEAGAAAGDADEGVATAGGGSQSNGGDGAADANTGDQEHQPKPRRARRRHRSSRQRGTEEAADQGAAAGHSAHERDDTLEDAPVGGGASDSAAGSRNATPAAAASEERRGEAAKAGAAMGGGELDESSPAQVGLVRFTVERAPQVGAGSSVGEQRVWTIVAKEGKAARMTVAKIKRYIAKHSQPAVAPASIRLRIGDEPLLDEWTGADFGLTDGTRITLDETAPDPAAPTAGTSATSLGALGTRGTGTGTGTSSAGDPGVMRRIEKRLQLRRVFQSVAGADPGASVDRRKLRDALAADKAASSALAGSVALHAGLQVCVVWPWLRGVCIPLPGARVVESSWSRSAL